jgi:muramoyltetrapeptide carboxypeptidase
MSMAAFVPAPRLRRGDVVRIVAPAGPVREDELEQGLRVLATRYTPRHDPDVVARAGYLAGDDDRRLRELLSALADPEARGVIALRGGYGTMRLLPALGPALAGLRAVPKVIIGSSDMTALGGVMLRAGLGWVHGPMLRTLGRTDDASLERLWRVLEDPEHVDDAAIALRGVLPGVARGPLSGGNLSVLAALCGTPYLPELAGTILLLEDVGERPYRLDRLLTQLLFAGALRGIRGVLLGELTDCTGRDGDPAPEDVVVERLRPLGVPIVAGFPAAHGGQCFALRMGEVVEIDGGRGTLRTKGVKPF